MSSRKAIFLFFIVVLSVFFIFLFFWLINRNKSEPIELDNVNLVSIENNTEDKLREVVNKTIRDLNLSLAQECRGDNGSFLCEGSANGCSFQISFIKKDYGSWVNSWNILLNRTNKREGESISKSRISDLDVYSQSLTENIEEGLKRVWETTSIFNNGYSFSVIACAGPPESAGRISSTQIIEKLISNLKKYE